MRISARIHVFMSFEDSSGSVFDGRVVAVSLRKGERVKSAFREFNSSFFDNVLFKIKNPIQVSV